MSANATEIAIYAVETKVMIQVLWGLLLITIIGLISVSIAYGLQRVKARSQRRRESQLSTYVASKSKEISRLEGVVASLTAAQLETSNMAAQVQRAKTLRTKSEQRLTDQNKLVDALRTRIDEKEAELRLLRPVVDLALEVAPAESAPSPTATPAAVDSQLASEPWLPAPVPSDSSTGAREEDPSGRNPLQ